MDPTANLYELREILNAPGALDADAVARVRELFDALDNWIGRGGFLPDDWKHADGARVD